MSRAVHRKLRIADAPKGADVIELQQAANTRLRARKQDGYLIAVDGEYGPKTARAVNRALYLLGVQPLGDSHPDNGGVTTLVHQTRIRHPDTRTPAAVARGRLRSKKAIKKARKRPLREKALSVAEDLVGVMEHGGNNQGDMVMKIIRANGGVGPEPWCGDFVAWCYRKAGSKLVERRWASVGLLGMVLGVQQVRNPKPGDIVRYEFTGDNWPDHTGLFVEDLGTEILAIEGNTGATGAVSDSSTGGDGVYKKRRPKSLVRDYRRVRR